MVDVVDCVVIGAGVVGLAVARELALAGREVTHIAVSHTHRDHSPLARRLKAETGAIIVAEGPHRAARPLHRPWPPAGWHGQTRKS